jgi:hypothetical protein
MTSTINVTQLGDYLWKVNVAIDDIISGETTVCCDTQEEAENYGQVFLADIRRNNPRTLGDVVFDWEVVEDDLS